ncbi:hypothetical protein [Patulibacter minatonensis]|uniref:hypothetical protein n=1 Tax=Patulibacter minatonensis TaxID=298163 RepID=UPI0004792D08|nr:hypothetical protein [Patulibacter minatonensis]
MRAVPPPRSSLIVGGLVLAGLVVAPAAQAGWTTPRSLPGDGFAPVAVAIDGRGNGAVLGQTDPSPTAGDRVVLGARVLRGTAVGSRRTDLAGLSAIDLDVDARGSSAVVGSRVAPPGSAEFYAPPELDVRGAGAAFGPPIGLPAPAGSTTLRTARNARGDVAVGLTAVDGTSYLQVRPAGGELSAPVAVSAPGSSALSIAIGDDGTTIAGWLRDGVAEVRVREPDGTTPSGSILGAPATDVAVAAGSRGRVLAAAVAQPAGQPLRQLIAVDRPGPGAFAGPRVLDTAAVVDSPAVAVAGSERLVAWRRGPSELNTAVRAAGRRGAKPLRTVRVPRVINAKGVAGDRTISPSVRAAVAEDGGAVIAFGYHDAVHTAVRTPGRRSFDAPRAVSALGGGNLPGLFDGPSSRPLAAARGGRAILAFPRVSDGRPQVAVLRRGGRDRSTRSGARPPVLRWGRPVFDLSTTPGRVRIPVDCSRACRATFPLRVTGGGSGSQTATVLLRRRGARTLDVGLTARFDRAIRRRASSTVTLRVRASATTRYGGRTSETRTYRRFPVTP